MKLLSPLKKPRNFIRLIIVVFITARLTSGVTAQPLPTSIPTASNTNGLYDWIITNQAVYPAFRIDYTDTNGVGRAAGNVAVLTHLDSYATYRNLLVNQVMMLMAFVQTNGNPPNPSLTIKITSFVTYNSQTPYGPMFIQSTASSLSDVTTDWLDNLTPSYINVMVSIPSLQQFTVLVSDANPPYTNGWSVSSGVLNNQPSPYLQERTTTNWLVLNTWYLLEQYHARFTVSVSGQTNTYTQYGALLVPPALTMPDAAHIQAVMAQGSDTTIESTTNFNGWSSAFTVSGLTGTAKTNFTVNPTAKPNQFFRAYSN